MEGEGNSFLGRALKRCSGGSLSEPSHQPANLATLRLRRSASLKASSFRGLDDDEDPTKPRKFKGVTQHKNNRRYEAHIWDKNMQRTTPGKGGRMKGRQVYLGSYSAAVDAARAHDYAALAFSFEETSLNFPGEYEEAIIKQLRSAPRDGLVELIKQATNGYTKSEMLGEEKKRTKKQRSSDEDSEDEYAPIVKRAGSDASAKRKKVSDGSMRGKQAQGGGSSGEDVDHETDASKTISSNSSVLDSSPLSIRGSDSPSAFGSTFQQKEQAMYGPGSRLLQAEGQPDAGRQIQVAPDFGWQTSHPVAPICGQFYSATQGSSMLESASIFDSHFLPTRIESFDQNLLDDMARLEQDCGFADFMGCWLHEAR